MNPLAIGDGFNLHCYLSPLLEIRGETERSNLLFMIGALDNHLYP